MSDSQLNTVERLLKEQKKSKRELAGFLKIKENSINRTLRNPNISILKLEKTAEFLNIDIQDFLFGKKAVGEPQVESKSPGLNEKENGLTIENLSEALNRSTKTVEMLVKIIADNNLTKSVNAGI